MTSSWKALPVPYAIETADRVPKERYFDERFFGLEAELLWPRVWQMACRLEEMPRPGDFVEYEILDQSVVVVRSEDMGVSAFMNACRHRGVRVVEGRGSRPEGFVCPFHGWSYRPDGTNSGVTGSKGFSDHNLVPCDLDMTPVRCEAWGGCAWVNFDDAAPPLRDCLEPMASVLDAWRVDSLRAEWWYACRLPCNWKLAEEAFLEQYHVLETHPQLRIPNRFPGRDPSTFDPRAFIQAELEYLRTMSDGMGGMVHRRDVEIAEGIAEMELPAEHVAARREWERCLNQAITYSHGGRGCDIPDLNELDDQGLMISVGYCFPHYFVLPMYSSAAAYRFRPLGPQETLMDIWSLTRFPAGEEPETPPIPEPWGYDDPRWPPIPTQDFSNLPRQQRGLHARTFKYMRLSARNEGHISNYQRLIDGFLAGLTHERLLPALSKVNVDPLETPVVDIEL